MIDATDFTIPGSGVLRNKLGITDSTALLKATTDSTVLRLAELHASPIRGGFDSAHLQAIHHHLYQDLYDWAGELRPIDAGNSPASQVEKSLNNVFDRLGRENHLKGFPAAVGAKPTCEPPSAIHFNSSHISLAACHLLSGSLARHFLTMRSSIGGVIG